MYWRPGGKGIYVSEGKDKAFLTLLDFTQEKEQLLDALEVRKLLEREILRMVIHKATAEEIDELGEITKVLMDKYHQGVQQDLAEDKKFPYTIYLPVPQQGHVPADPVPQQ